VSYIHGGHRELIGGMDEALSGKRAGDRVDLQLSEDQGFGDHNSDLTFTDDLDNVPPEFRFVGAEVEMANDQGDVRTFYVTHVGDRTLTVDGNHPLAGKALHVHVRIQEVRDPTPQDLEQDREVLARTGGPLH
jgi:FKBP-type peptidyl-prolyl cis-trans isomerase SlyD